MGDKPNSELSNFELDIAIKQLADAISEDPSDPEEACELAELVREQYKRQRVAKARIGEYFRQREIRESRRTSMVRGEKPRRLDDSIDSVHADRYAYRVSLLYSDIEILAPAVERDTKTAFVAEQKRRLAAVLEANPRLTDKQREALELVSTGEGESSSDFKYGTSYSVSRRGLDGRTIGGLIKRGILDVMPTGSDYHRTGVLFIAELPK